MEGYRWNTPHLPQDGRTRNGRRRGLEPPSQNLHAQYYRFTTTAKPISANRYWRHANGRTYISPEARTFREQVAWAAKAAGLPCREGAVELSVYYYHAYPHKRLDLDNVLKTLIDSLKGVAMEDDRQVRRIQAECWHDAENPRITVEVTYLPVVEAPVTVKRKRGKNADPRGASET